MQDKDHVNIFQGQWMRCRDVRIIGTEVHCDLALDRTYDLISAYKTDPHLQLISCDSNEQLVAFLRSWGPLTLSWEEFQRGTCSASLENYWLFQQWLKGVVCLLSAFKSMEGERESLQDFIRAEIAREHSHKRSSDTNFLLSGLARQLGIQGEVLPWSYSASMAQIRDAIAFLGQSVAFGAATSLQCFVRAGKPTIQARWNVATLQEAVRWMVWYDEFTKHPLVCCQACRKVFRPETAHARRYCSYECAHRVAAREWQRKQSKLKKGEKHGTRETR